MATYVMSDVHGFYQTFLNALKRIDFSDEDELYVIGDVIDRGFDGVKLLAYTMNRPNVHLLMGNHEYMCMDYFSEKPDETVVRRWNRNRNFYTLKGFDALSPEEKKQILEYIKNLPVETDLAVNGKRYYLVHGFTGEDDYHRVWNRPKTDTPAPFEDKTLIIGHTPVCEFECPGTDEDMYVYSRELTKKGDHFRIFHGNGFINVDCCVGYAFSAARLAVLRLDDLAEFYEPVAEEE